MRLPPADLETYPESERPRLRLSRPPDVAKRVKLLRAEVNRFLSATAGMGVSTGAAGKAGPGNGGVGALGIVEGTVGGVAGGGGLDPTSEIQEGTSGLSPAAPPYEFEVPISVRLAYGF